MQPPARIGDWVSLLRWHAAERGEAEVLTFLADDGRCVAEALDFGELDRRARAIAAWLQSLVPAGERALLLYPPGLEYVAAFFGCLYAGVVAVPAYPPQQNRRLSRIDGIVADAGATIALTTEATLARLRPWIASTSRCRALRWLATDLCPQGVEEDWHVVEPGADAVAFLQYTSGSTGAPKGVVVTHGNLLANSEAIRAVHARVGVRTGVSWLPAYHDLGLVCGILQPVYAGLRGILMSPLAFLQHPGRWLAAVAAFGAEVSGGPNFAYDLCCQRVTESERAALDLSGWRLAVTGAEPVHAATLTRFAATFASCGFRPDAFYPAYGLAEATLFVSGGEPDRVPVVRTLSRTGLADDRVVETEPDVPDAIPTVACGRPLPGNRVVIVDPASRRPCEADRVGEIWIEGPSVARGYWGAPEASAETFDARTADGDGPFLRTGDLGFLRDGELFVAGRLKDLIIIDGRNHWPQDIEGTVAACHPALRPNAGIAFAVPGDERERLVIVHEVERPHETDAAAVVAAIRAAIVDHHDIAVDAIALTRPGSVPKTSSGKLRRSACRRAWLDATLAPIAAWPTGTGAGAA